MEFLKKYYEKVTLGALLFGFLLALVFLLQKTATTGRITERDLKFAPPETKYQGADFNGADFDFKGIFSGNNSWTARLADKDVSAKADLVAPMKAMRCSNENCKKIVPRATVEKELQCPICKSPLEPPPDVALSLNVDRTGPDTDEDGMPDRYERKNGFNPQLASDASEDADEDGFSNLYEFLMDTDPQNEKSYPSMEKRIFLAGVKPIALPIKLTKVSPNRDPKDKDSKRFWDITLTVNSSSQIVNIGAEITVKNQRYKVVDAEYKTKEELENALVMDADQSRVTLESLDGGEKLVLEVNKPVYLSAKAQIRDSVTWKGFTVSPGEEFEIGEEGKRVKFKVLEIDAEKKQVELLMTRLSQQADESGEVPGEKVLLTMDVKVPKRAKVGYSPKNDSKSRFNNDAPFRGDPNSDLPPERKKQKSGKKQKSR